MAKNSKKNGSHTVEGIPADEAVSSEAVSKPEVTTEHLRSLFDNWKAADAELETVKATIDAAAVKRSECVRALVETLGNKGPWVVDGMRLSVSVRGDTYSMSKESDAKFTL